MTQSDSTSRQKIAILGGGIGAMSAAFHLTAQPGWQDRYEISVYQMGWRLGGKGASGRNPAVAQRIEEHGLHIWFGFYDNAFALMQMAYAELGRPAGAPLATWQEAFKPQHFIALTERVGEQWKVWPIETPPKPGSPGQGSEEVTLFEIVSTLRAWIRQWLRDLDAHLGGGLLADSDAWRARWSWDRRGVGGLDQSASARLHRVCRHRGGSHREGRRRHFEHRGSGFQCRARYRRENR